MNWLVTTIAGAAGPYVVGGLAALLLISSGGWAIEAVAHGQTARALTVAKGQIAADAKALAALRSSLALSEARRATEHDQAVTAAGDAQDACAARVRAALRSANKIRSIIEAPHVTAPNGCPARAIVGAGQLRDALQPGA